MRLLAFQWTLATIIGFSAFYFVNEVMVPHNVINNVVVSIVLK